MSSNAAILAKKKEIEARFDRDDGNELRREYLGILLKLSRELCGILDFRWPGVAAPLYMRCGSTDISNFIQMFVHNEYGFPLDFAPARILDLGAYAGYASTYLTTRFPDAEIVSIEPSSANFQMLTLNTGTYSRIQRFNVAVWGHSSVLDVARSDGGDWGVQFNEGKGLAGAMPALSIPDILASVGWDAVDYVKCDIEGAEASVFTESGAMIANMVNCCTVETHDGITPGSSQIVKACFPATEFVNSRNGEFEVFVRRGARDRQSRHISRVSLLRPERGTRPITLTNVAPQGWAYYMFDRDSCQLCPAKVGDPVPGLVTTVDLNGHTAFECDVSVSYALGHPVDFVVQVISLEDGSKVADGRVTVPAGETRRWVQTLAAPAFGQYGVTLETVMSLNATPNHTARANWIAPCFSG